jgi:hypothetical protein
MPAQLFEDNSMRNLVRSETLLSLYEEQSTILWLTDDYVNADFVAEM